MRFDSVRIGAADHGEAVRQYRLLLGQEGTAAEGLHRFDLQRGAIELVVGEPGLRSLRFRREVAEDGGWPGDAAAYHGLHVLVAAGGDTAPPPPPAAGVPHAIDHVVVQTPDPDRAIALWRDRLGVRLALDREFPQRGLRLLFFRSGGVTLEFSGALGAAGTGPDSLWGLALRVADLAACRARLLGAGVEVSQVRPGQKTGTQVATVRSHDLGVPTLLIQPAG